MTRRLLYLARHGAHDKDETAEDPDGNEDGPLNGVGREQAGLLGERLRGIPFAAVHHSTLRRSAQTAAIVASHLPGVPVHPADDLRECIPLVPEAHHLDDPQRTFFAGWPQAVLDLGAARAAAVIDRHAGWRDDDRPELVITHGNLISWFVCEALDIPRWRWLSMPFHYNCALTIVLYRADRPPSLVSYNDMGHLPPDLRGTDYPPQFRF